MERKKTNIKQLQLHEELISHDNIKKNEIEDYHRKIPKKIRISPYSEKPMVIVKNQFSNTYFSQPGGEINIISKYSKKDSNLMLSVPHTAKDRISPSLHLPLLNKKDPGTSLSLHRSPTISPFSTKNNLEFIKQIEDGSPLVKEDNADVLLNFTKKKPSTRGSSDSRSTKFRRPNTRVNQALTKQREVNIDTLLIFQSNNNFAFLMQEYNRRQNLPENTKIFILTGQHDFIRRALKKRNWYENKLTNSVAFNLKWCYNDCDSDYKNLKPGQFYNHFPNNRELTTKSGLAKNLKSITDFNVNIDNFFPRCYDLSDNLQINELTNDYYRTCIFNIIKKVHLGFFVESNILKLVIAYAESIITDYYSKCEKMNAKIYEIKHEELMKIMVLEIKQKDEVDAELLAKVNMLYEKLNKIFPQFSMEGCENIWIIKPGQNARGSGVRCVRSLQEILDSGLKMQSRIVQKYTESPLLIPLSFGLCKFDLRIWVLVTSFDPLIIYMYNTFYSRICQEAYSLDSLDAFKHLANYSVQKHIAKNQSETIWSLEQLVLFLGSIRVSWEDILKKIHYIIIQTLKAVSDLIETKPRCFELYGFDIIIDSDYKPWLLEVNLSPACAERTDFLTQTLDSMGEGLIRIVFDGEVHEPIYDTFLNLKKAIKCNTQEWILLYKGENLGDEYCYHNNNLEIFGEKFNIKREKVIERKFVMTRAALTIQKHARKFLIRVRGVKKTVNNNVLAMQKIIRRKLAYLEYFKRMQVKMCVRIQSFWRMKIGQRILKSLMDLKKIEIIQSVMLGFLWHKKFKEMKIKRSCLNIQGLFRQKLAKVAASTKRYFIHCVILIQKCYRKRFKKLNNTAVIIQKHFRGLLGRRRFNKELRFINSIVNIQKQIRKFFDLKQVRRIQVVKSCLVITKFIRISISLKSLSYYCCFKAARVIQKYWRRHSAENLLKKKKQEKIIIIQNLCYVQKILKGFKERKKFDLIKNKKAVMTIQKIFRGYRSRKYYKILKTVYAAAIMIQKYFRGFICRKRYLYMRRIFRDEIKRKFDFIKKKKEMEKKALEVTERLSKSKAVTDNQRIIFSRMNKKYYN